MSSPSPIAKRPQAILARHEFAEAERSATLRAREDLLTHTDQFIRVDIPPRLRHHHPKIHTVGHIEGDGGRLLTLIRSDVEHGAAADDRFEGPSIGVMQKTNELTIELVVLLTPDAAGALAVVMCGGQPTGADPAGLDETALGKTGAFQGCPTGAVVIASPPQRVDEHSHLVGLVNTLDGDKIFLIRGEDGGITIALQLDFVAHLSLAATQALAEVLEEFAAAHGVDIGSSHSSDLEST